MFDRCRQAQFDKYRLAHKHFVANPQELISLEKFCADLIYKSLQSHLNEIAVDYDEASYLYPFWQNYPPDERGRQPVGDQFPWIEVGEHAVGCKLGRYIAQIFRVRDAGLPTGADQRYVISHPEIKKITGITDSAWLFADIKSVGPRDDADHTVMSHNQISGDGIWDHPEDGVRNTVLKASGARASHDFHCSLPPIYVLSNNTIAPVVLMVVKPVYAMLALKGNKAGRGQPLSRITLVTIPNGILLTLRPGYLRKYPSLLFPGKDDKEKNPLKIRARISFEILRKIDQWRVRDINLGAGT